MDVAAFGDRTEEVREWALHELSACVRWRAPVRAATPPPAPVLAVVPTTPPPALPLCAPAHHLQLQQTFAPALVPTPARTLPCPQAAASIASSSALALRSDVLGVEEREITRAVDEFFAIVPISLLLHTPSALPERDRVVARRAHLLTCGVSSVRAGTAFVREWLAFCSRRSVANHGVPVDADLLSAFLSEVDAAARQRAAGKLKQTGASVLHATACAARWTAAHAGLPFDIAKATQVRKTSAPSREQEPSWSAMWEPAILVHLLRTAVSTSHKPLVRAMAASTYFVCAASMRLVNGLRSAPPTLDDHGVFHGIAVLSKGKRRSTMAPQPWSVPCVSPDGETTDTELASGLLAAISTLPKPCCSMFPKLLDACGSEVPVERAIAACPSERAADAKLESTVTFLLTLPPLSLSRAEARGVASRKHGPRHLLPEVARVLGLPLPARNELGLWAASSLRIQSMPNRYSRDAERMLSRVLRGMVMHHIRSRMPYFRRIGLEQLVASPSEMQSAFGAANIALARASPSSHLGDHTSGGGADAQTAGEPIPLGSHRACDVWY